MQRVLSIPGAAIAAVVAVVAIAAIAAIVAIVATVAVAVASAAEPPACALGIETLTSDAPVLRLRALHPPGAGSCTVATDTLRTTLVAALDRPDAEVTVALGRLIDYAPLACALAASAARDPGWNARRGRARDGSGDNLWTGRRLARADLLGGLAPAGWTLVAVSVEKVLKGEPAHAVPGCAVAGNGLPFDAQVWLRVRRRP